MPDTRPKVGLAEVAALTGRTEGSLSLLYAATLFVSAVLLFSVQPMFAKMALPLYGGASSVWTTAVMFFQLALLSGYLYAHVLGRHVSMRIQVALHVALVGAAFALLPVATDAQFSSAPGMTPVVSLLLMLTLGLGLPFLVIAATAPLLQRWFSATRHAQAADPYFLYSASNLGSVAALLAYPTIVETLLGLKQQSRAWALGFGVLASLIGMCALCAWRYRRQGAAAAVCSKASPAWKERLMWMLLAFAPSSLLLGVTQHVTNEIAAIPLLWVVPLFLYTLTYVNAFARRPPFRHGWVLRLQPPLVILLALVWILNTYFLVFLLHLLVFFAIAMMCHGELALRRPVAAHLTDFYLCIAVGGALGGLFNAVVAPVLFSNLLEYPLIIGLACMLRSTSIPAPRLRLADLLWPALLAAILGVLFLSGYHPLERGAVAIVVYLQVVGLVLYLAHVRPVSFGLAVIAVLLGSPVLHGADDILVRQRSFFGVHTVLKDKSGKFHVLMHGITIHGAQYLAPDRRREQTTYYHRDGPLGQLFSVLGAHNRFQRVASVGLGVGTAACYRQAGQEWTFYELDPVVARLAKDTRYFHFLADCAPDADIVIGDGRQSLRAVPDQHFDLIIVDTFGSDSIPVHMITREALALYVRKLRPGGVVTFHITNQYLDLAPVLANLAAAGGLAGLMPGPRLSFAADDRYAEMQSHWIAIARDPRDLVALETEEGWVPLPADLRARLWTDDYSNVLGALK